MITPNEYRTVLFLAPQDIKETTIIGEEVNENVIRSAVCTVQDVDLQKTIGSNLLRRLQELVGTDDIRDAQYEPYKVLLDEYIQPYMQAAVVAEIAYSLAYKFRNKGVIETYDTNVTNAAYNDIAKLIQKYKVDAAAYRDYLCKYLKANSSLYPELCGCSCSALEDSYRKPSAPCPFYLG
jgi:hypothetical protein